MVASELARHGVLPRIIDRGPAPATTSRALVVQPRTLEIFDDIGVIDQAIAVGDSATGLTITFATKTVELDFTGQLTGPQNYTAYPEPRTLSQADTERILTELLSKQGVEIGRGRALTDLTQDGEAVTVSIRGDDGSIETLRCRWVIGCDGAHSAVRKAAGIPFAGSTYRDEFIMADAELDWKLPHGGLYGFPSPAGIFAAFSMPGENRYRIFGNFPPGPEGAGAEYSEPTHEEFQAMVNARVPFPAEVVKEYWVTRYRVHSRTVPRYRDGRVFLVGDAAHVHSPAGAQGMNTGIQDAYNLAWKLDRAPPDRSPVAQDDRPVVLGLRWAESAGPAGSWPGGAAAGQPCADSPVDPQAVHRLVGPTAPQVSGQPAQRRGWFGLARRAGAGRPCP
jgi:2-polyprenyl-6-methoxyphenol hydroxylase-like FAD-dependent oxidoreductase